MLSLQVATRRFLRSTQRLPPMLTAALHSSAAAFQTEGSGASMPANAVNFNAMNQNDLRVAYTDPNDIPTGWKGVKRFYDEVNVRAMDGSGEPTTPEKAAYWAVLIDGRTLRTNGMSDLEIPTQGLALAIAAEFACQKEIIHPPSTPLYNLTCMALDMYKKEENWGLESTEEDLTEEDKLRDRVREYLETDTICYRVNPNTLDPRDAILRRRQDKYYGPLIKWFEGAYGGPIDVTEAFKELEQPAAAFEVLDDLVFLANPFLKAVLFDVLGTVKSTIIATAFLHQHITAEQAFDACRVEEEHQINENGFVEEGHDTQRAQTKSRLGAAATMLWLNPSCVPPAPEKISAAAREKEAAVGRIKKDIPRAGYGMAVEGVPDLMHAMQSGLVGTGHVPGSMSGDALVGAYKQKLGPGEEEDK